MAYYIVLLAAYDRLPAAQALAINYTWVLSLAVLTVLFLGQRFSVRLAVGLFSGYAGVVLVVAGSRNTLAGNVDWAGIGLAFLSTWIWAAYWVITARRTQDHYIAARQLIVEFARRLLWAFSRVA